jgi:hypothetical protein
MTRTEAEQFARRCLYNYRENAARLEQKIFKYEIARERGSRIEQQFGERGGKASAGYIESVPGWLEEIEMLEAQIVDLRLQAPPIQRLLRDLEETQRGEFIIYRFKYEEKLSWERAREKAADEHNIGGSAFKTMNRELIKMAIRYLDLPVEDEAYPKSYPESYPGSYIESSEKAI